MVNVRFLSAARNFNIFNLLIFTILALSSAASAVAQPRHVPNAEAPVNLSTTVAPVERASILVRVFPRTDKGNGEAVVLLMDGRGNILESFQARLEFPGLAQGVKGPNRKVRNGDTPFGVYKYTSFNGGHPDSKLGLAFGTGKINVDDIDMYGEVKEAGRSLIRLHGGGSRLLKLKPPRDPYEPDHPLLPTLGCVRMKNRDVNTLIQAIKNLPGNPPLEFIFIGSQKYLTSLATDPQWSALPWQKVLQTNLRISVPPPGAEEFFLKIRHVDSERNAVRELNVGRSPQSVQSSDAELLELISTFSEDVGERGQEAWNRLRSHPDLIATLLRIQETLPTDSRVRPQIAFVLCNLGHDYQNNKRVIETAFDATPRYRGFYPDEAETMISRLIDKNDDAGLLRTLFTATSRADGALSEGLSITFSANLRDKTRFFLTALKNEPKDVRLRVGRMIQTARYLTNREIARIRRTLKQIKDSSLDLKETVTELLTWGLRIIKRG